LNRKNERNWKMVAKKNDAIEMKMSEKRMNEKRRKMKNGVKKKKKKKNGKKTMTNETNDHDHAKIHELSPSMKNF